MANALPILLVGGAALLLMSKKKKKTSAAAGYETIEVTKPPPPKPLPAPADASASVEVWMQRQRALAYLGGIGFCSCSPGAIDGKYGTNTKNAIMAFQKAVGITVDGKWGPNTDKIMGQTLAAAATGLIKIPKTSQPSTENGPTELLDPENVLEYLPQNVIGVRQRVDIGADRKVYRHILDPGDRFVFIDIVSGNDDSAFDEVVTFFRELSIKYPKVNFFFHYDTTALRLPTDPTIGLVLFEVGPLGPDDFWDRLQVRYRYSASAEKVISRIPEYLPWLYGMI